MFAIHAYRDADLSREQIRAVVSLLNSIWSNKDKTLDELTDAFIDAAQAKEQPGDKKAVPRRFIIWEENQAIAHANTFERTLLTADGPIPVMALSGVCVAATHRGRGLGEAISRKALDRVDRGDFALALFQTPVPAFYARLGARTVDNRFVNSTHEQDPEAYPWIALHVMIYPKHHPWPDGVIDINGPRY